MAVEEVLREVVAQLGIGEGRPSQRGGLLVAEGLDGVDELADDLQLAYVAAKDIAC